MIGLVGSSYRDGRRDYLEGHPPRPGNRRAKALKFYLLGWKDARRQARGACQQVTLFAALEDPPGRAIAPPRES